MPAGHSPPAGSANAQHRTSVVVVRDLSTLSGFIPAWEELAATALEPNVFYEHWMLLPALEAFGAGKDISIVLVLIHDSRNPNAPVKLGGLFPLERIPSFGKLKVSALSLWQYIHCYLCTPLVRADTAYECLAELFQWLRSGEASASLLELKGISGDGPFHRVLVDLFNDSGMLHWVSHICTRALLRDANDKKVGSVVSNDLRRTLRRKERRLSERGRVEHLVMRPEDAVERWIEEFLRVEAGGWKGRRGTALACSEPNRRFFTEMATAAFRRGRLLMLGINFNGRPIARRCALLAGEGSFAFKTAFDEEFARFSPGVMLEVDNIRQLQELPGVRWMDFCTARHNSLINRLSNDRRTIQSLAVGGGALGELMAWGLPLLKWTKHRLLKTSTTDAGSFVHRKLSPR